MEGLLGSAGRVAFYRVGRACLAGLRDRDGWQRLVRCPLPVRYSPMQQPPKPASTERFIAAGLLEVLPSNATYLVAC